MSIISPTGWVLIIKDKLVTPVVAWNDEGFPIFVSSSLGAAVPVTDVTDNYRLERTDGPVVGVLPAGGWRVQFADGDDGPIPPEPLIGWAVTADGNALPILRLDGDHGEIHTAVDLDSAMVLLPPSDATQAVGQ